MIIRLTLGILFVIVLIPHEPDLGLPREPSSGVERIFQQVRTTMTTNVSRAAADLRSSRSGRSFVIGRLAFPHDIRAPDVTIPHRKIPQKIEDLID